MRTSSGKSRIAAVSCRIVWRAILWSGWRSAQPDPIQNNSGLSQGLRSAIGGTVDHKDDKHLDASWGAEGEQINEHVGHGIRGATGHCWAQPISLAGDHRYGDGGAAANGCG